MYPSTRRDTGRNEGAGRVRGWGREWGGGRNYVGLSPIKALTVSPKRIPNHMSLAL